jgi:REase_DpnII-MboI/Uncharacterized protein conserved in bacteria (DUF2321)
MTQSIDTTARDVMLVCRNGHVITDRLRSNPESDVVHCDRCGATTLDRCPTCGHALPGALPVPGLLPVGRPRPPAYCSLCGAAFPWTRRPAPPAPPVSALETMLRRLPRVVHELLSRHGERPPFRVADLYDLEDLLRALLPLQFDAVRPLRRTPTYAAGTRTDFLLMSPAGGRTLALTAKWTTTALTEQGLTAQWDEDVRYHEAERTCGLLIGFVYDPEGRLRDPASLETAWSRPQGDVELRCVVVGL